MRDCPMRAALAAFFLACGCASAAPGRIPSAPPSPRPAPVDDWRRGLLYLALTDRFDDGNPGNDEAGQPGCHDPAARDLFHGGDLAGLRARIPYLKDLGVTALWATPLYAQVPRLHDACGYHGYWADETDPDDGALEPRLGTWDDVAALVGDLHSAGMRFVLDMVVNHPGRGARIVHQHPDWFHPDDTCDRLGDRDVYCSLHGLPDYAQEKPEVAAYLTAASRGWVQRVKPDGIRMDTAKNVLTRYFASSFVPAVRAERADLFLVAEYFEDGTVEPLLPVLDAGFDSAFDFPLHRALVDAFARGGSVDRIGDVVARNIRTLGIERATRLVTFLDNHDVPRFMSEAPGALPADELERRYAVALVAMFTLPGIPQIYQGDELGMLGAYGANRHDMPPWAWKASTRPGAREGFAGDAQAIFALVQRLARRRASDEALWRGSYAEVTRASAGANVLAFVRTAGADDADLVVLSGDASPVTVTVGTSAGGWHDGVVLKDAVGLGAPEAVTVRQSAVTVTLPAHAGAIFRP
jgi:glycosidase